MKHLPEEDILLAAKHHFTFTVAHKADADQPWQVVEREVQSLSQAVRQAQRLDSWEGAVFTTDGFLYWSSQNPQHFRSAVLQRGQLIIQKLSRFETIRWRAFLRVKSDQDVETKLDQFSTALETVLNLTGKTQNQKDKTLFEVTFTSPLASDDIAAAIFQTLCLSRNVADRWHVTGPFEYEGGRWEFKGQATQPALTGVTWVEFVLSNFVYQWSDQKTG